ncbi:MAG: hypothetical protein D6796_12490 [Caldilineae bacterium]|nr:MAG: hypothetical protein D6796_12490 [Caldilineae bacterium]
MIASPAIARLEGLFFLLVFALLILFFASRARKKRVPPLRPVAAFRTMQGLMARAIEAGRTVHLSLGVGSLHAHTAAETMAGVAVLEAVAQQGAAAGAHPLVTTADPAVALLAQHITCAAAGSDPNLAAEAAARVRWISPQPAAYAAGVMGLLSLEEIAGNIMVGRFGDEFLLMGEAAHRQTDSLTTVAGATDPNVLPFVLAVAPEGLWGEELFAAGAYLSQKAAHIGSLLAQDAMRWLLAWLILAAVLLRAFGWIG